MNRALESRYLPAAQEALEQFSIEAENIELIKQSENVTFRISVFGCDTDFALRLHRPGYNSIDELESERQWMRALKAAGIPVQKSTRTRLHQSFALVEVPATGEQRYAGMTTWHEGVLLSDYLESGPDTSERQHIFHRIGEMAARIHNHSTNWREPPGFQRHRLDIEGLLGEAPFWGRFWEHVDLTESEREILLQARETARNALEEYGEKADNFSLIHADLHPDNIVHDKGALKLIDFDDSAYGWHMSDLASALFEYLSAPDFTALRSALLDGYREHRSLTQEDIGMLPTFLLVRGMAIIGWFHERPEHAGSAFFDEVKSWVIETCDSMTVCPSQSGGRVG